MSLVPYEVDSDDDEKVANDSFIVFKRGKKRKAPVKIVLEKLSSFEDIKDFEQDAKGDKKSNTTRDLFSILPPPKSKRNNLIVPRILRTKSIAPTSQDKYGSFVEKRARRVPEDPPNNKPVANCAPEVRDPKMLRNSDFRKALEDIVNRGKELARPELLHDRDRVMAITDPKLLEKPLAEQVNKTCKKKNHISYLLQMAKTNEQDLKNKWSANKYTRQQTKAKYGF